MNTMLWVFQVLVAVVVMVTGTVKLAISRELLVEHMRWAASWPRWRIKLLGVAELLGALGLVLPMATGIAPLLTPLAAVGLALLMAGAVHTHRRLCEGFVPALVVGALCVAIAIGRLVLASLP